MGQRHQIYIRLKAQKNEKPQVIGFHNQWLWGQKALKTLARVLRFTDKEGNLLTGEYHGYENATDILYGLLSTDPSTGEYSSFHPFQSGRFVKCEYDSQCTLDPRLGDNNNGITVIDLSGKAPKYCYMSIGHLECLDDSIKHDKDYKNLVPLSAHHYLALQYKIDHDKAEFNTISRDLITYLSQFKTLTLPEVKKIFPAMYAKVQ